MKTGITFSCFDLFHTGHVLMLKEAKSICDYLIVGLQSDPTIDRPDTKNKPVQTIFERYIQLDACKYVDQIIVYESEQDLIDILNIYPIDVRVIGEEYNNTAFTGKDAGIDNDIELYFNSRRHSFSTSSLRNRT